MKPEDSLGAMLAAVKDVPGPMHMVIVMREDVPLSRREIGDCLASALGPDFTIESAGR